MAATPEADIASLRADVGALRTDVQALTQGLTLMLESQGTVGELLERVLAAVATETPAESPLEKALAAIAAAIADQSEVMDRVGSSLDGLKRTLAGAIIRGAGAPDAAAPAEA